MCINRLLFLLNMPNVANLICQFPREPTDDISSTYGLASWFSGAEATVIADTSEVESYRLYFHDVPNRVLNDTVRRLTTCGWDSIQDYTQGELRFQ